MQVKKIFQRQTTINVENARGKHFIVVYNIFFFFYSVELTKNLPYLIFFTTQARQCNDYNEKLKDVLLRIVFFST